MNILDRSSYKIHEVNISCKSTVELHGRGPNIGQYGTIKEGVVGEEKLHDTQVTIG